MIELWELFIQWSKSHNGHWQLILETSGRGWLRNGGDLDDPLFKWHTLEEGIQEFKD